MFEKKESGESIEVRYENETLWLTQKSMAALSDVSNKTVSEHLSNVFSSGELDKDSTVRKFRIVQTEGTRQVTRNTDFYSLYAVISVGYRINSVRATQFRRRATKVLKHSECVTPELYG
ncbi:MAG: virulence RhuM family protein [Clostridia bacterium]|nr:virulence RhuM family protein [Clostridia bacterium]